MNYRIKGQANPAPTISTAETAHNHSLHNTFTQTLAAIFIAFCMLFVQQAQAETAAQLRTTINNYGRGGATTGTALSATVSGNTVTVTGNVANAMNVLELDIDAVVTVVWRATLGVDNDLSLLPTLRLRGAGIFNMESGTIGATIGYAVQNYSTGAVNITGGTISATATTGIAIREEGTGKITISGATTKVTSANTSSASGTILATSGVLTAEWLVIEGGTVENISTNANARAIYNTNQGVVTISGGTVQATGSGVAVYNSSNGKVNIIGGTISAAEGTAVRNDVVNGAVNISGGTVKTTTGTAVRNDRTGKITISGTASVTSTTFTSTSGTIYLAGSGGTTAERLVVQGGTVENTTPGGNAIYNASSGAVNISGGTVQAVTFGSAVYNASTGAVNISGGTLDSYTAVSNESTGAVTITGGTISAINTAVSNARTGTVIVAGATVTAATPIANSNNAGTVVYWNKGKTTYDANTSTDLTVLPATATAKWAVSSSKSGISYANDTTTGFVEVPGVTVSEGKYSYTKSGTTYTIYQGTSGTVKNQTIQGLIDAIKADANKAACTIQFGSGGTNVLNIGAEGILFNGGTSGNDWGTITLTGKITSEINSAGTITTINGVSLNSTADIANTNTMFGYAVDNRGTGTASISGGTVSVVATTMGAAVNNNLTGTVTITGGTITSTASAAVNNQSTGAVNISGTAQISATGIGTTGGTAVWNNAGGMVNISGGTITAAYYNGTAVHNQSTGTITISDGTVQTTYYGKAAILNNLSGTITISGGTVQTTESTLVVDNKSTGKVNISGGTVKATEIGTVVGNQSGTVNISGTAQISANIGIAVWNSAEGTVNISGGSISAPNNTAFNNAGTGIIIAAGATVTAATPIANTNPAGLVVYWNKGKTAYTAHTSEGISILPASATAFWLNQSGKAGISYDNGAKSGFVQVAGVTVAKVNPVTPTGISAFASQTLADIASQLPSGWAWESAGTTAVGAVGTRTHTAKYTPTDAENYNAMTGVSISVAVANAAGTWTPVATISRTYSPGLKLSDLALAAGYAWHDPETYLHAGDGQSFAATYLDPSGNYSAATGNITVNVAKATGVFGINTALDITYTSGLRLSDLALGDGYTWNAPTTALNAGNGQSFPATFTEPSGNYTTATGSVTINVAKAAGTFSAVAAINITYTQTLKLSNLTLPANYAWETPTTALNAGNAQSFSATFTDPSGNYETATGSVVVNVAKATPAAVTFPTAAGITYDPEVSLSSIAFVGGTGDGTFAWANPWEVPTVINSGFGVVFTPRDADNYDYTGITMTATVALAVAKANPVSNPPSDLVAVYGQTLAEVHLHEGWEWEVPLTTLVGNAGVRKFPAKFTPPDTDNYENLSGEIELEVHVAKADPTLPATPAGLTATFGQTLASVALPAGWSWATPTALVGNAGTQTHKAKFTPTDVANYNVVENIDISIAVSKTEEQLCTEDGKTWENNECTTPIRTPQIASSNIHAYAMGNSIVLQNLPAGAKVEVFDLRGRGVACNALAINNTITIPMQTKGMYIVKVSGTPNVLRVAVK